MASQIKVSVILKALAETKGFQAVNQELRAIELATKKMQPALNIIKTSMAAVGGVMLGAGAAMRGLVTDAIASASQINDLAHATGVSAESMQVLGHAATLNGSSIEDMAKAMVLLQSNAVDAAAGNQVLIEKFAKLGISAQEFNQLHPDQQMERFARAVANAKNPQEALAYAMDLVGAKNAPRLMAVLKELGEVGLAGFAQQAKSAGVVMSNDLIAKLDEAGDRIETFKKRITVLGGEIAETILSVEKNGTSLLGVEIPGSDAVANALEERDRLVKILGRDSLVAAEAAIKLAAEYAKVGNTKMAMGTIKTDGFFAAMDKTPGLNQDYLNHLTKMRAGVLQQIAAKNAEVHAATAAGLAQQKADDAEAIRAAAEAAQKTTEASRIARQAGNAKIQKAQFEFNQKLIADAARVGEAMSKTLEAQTKASIDAGKAMTDAYATPVEKAQENLKIAAELQAAGNLTADTYARVGKALADATETERIEKLRKSLNPLQKAFADCANQIEGHLTGALTDMVMTGKLGMKELGTAIMRDLVAALIRAQIVIPLMRAISGATGMAGLFGAPAADGGYRDGSKPYLVGEEGPEIFNPGGGGTITPADVTAQSMDAASSGGGGGGDTQVINLHFTNGVTRSELSAQMPVMIKQIKEAVSDSVRRGGSYRRSYA